MAHYLFQASYTPESWAGLIKNPENRGLAIAKLMESAGGKLESFYFAFGATDAYVIVDLPDNVAAGRWQRPSQQAAEYEPSRRRS